ncbi:MAG: FKBP-type peptidyl-prolyl cis-trans isomerase [Nitrososphaerales archaeon]
MAYLCSKLALETGTLVLVNLTGKVKDTNEPLETTVEEEAKALGIYDPSRRYEPRLVSVGEGWVIPGLDDALKQASVGEKVNIDIPPEKAFGQRDASKIKLIPLRKFGEKAHEIAVGDEVEVEGRVGVVRFVGSGRVQVDFNHRLAGKVLTYTIEVVKKLEEPAEKILYLIRRWLNIDEKKISLAIEGNIVKIQLPEETYLFEGLQISKRGISRDIFKYVSGVEKVVFIEEYQAEKKKEEKPQQEVKKIESQKTEDH